MFIKLKRGAILLACLLGVSGCYNHKQVAAPVVKYAVKISDIPNIYTVREGDSLYTIAWQYDLDFRTIAANNYLQSPDHIYPGQKLHLLSKSSKPRAVRGKRPPKIRQNNKQIPTVVAITNSKSSTQKSKIHNTIVLNKKWIKPAYGEIINTYSSKANDFNKGIDISGRLNDKILAAQAGKVVYSGEGLRGYGKLIIIKHNEMYLSAYAHNNKLLVKEGDSVQQGQQIAKMGRSDSSRIKLHFQIRKNGQPVDPLHYL